MIDSKTIFAIVLSLFSRIEGIDFSITRDQKTLFTTASLASSEIVNGQIIYLHGNVKIQRRERIIMPTLGTSIYPEDRLITANEAQLIVQCHNLMIQSIQNGLNQLNTCPKVNERIECTPGTARCPRRGDDLAWNNSAIPYIISPRQTNLLDNRAIILHWNAVAGATSYKVQVRGEDINWETEASGTEVIYSGPTLTPKVYYSLIVKANTGRSSQEEEMTGIGFLILSHDEKQKVESHLDELKEYQQLTQDGTLLSLISLYQQQDLKAEAIKMLQSSIKQSNEKTMFYLRLGELYSEIGLAKLSEGAYLRALELSKVENLEWQVFSLEKIGYFYANLEEFDKAIEYFKKAREQYNILGDIQKVSEFTNWIDNLEQLHNN